MTTGMELLHWKKPYVREAADEIERLRKELAEWRDRAGTNDARANAAEHNFRVEHEALVSAEAALATAQEEALTWWRYVERSVIHDEDKELYEKYRALAEKERT